MGGRGELQRVARLLGGEVASGAISCPGPGHSPLDRSMRVYQDWQSPTAFRVHSLAADDWQSCDAHLRDKLGLPRWEPARRRDDSGETDRQTRQSENAVRGGEIPQLDRTDDEKRTHVALDLFREAKSVSGTLAETYLIRRIGRAIDWPTCLRFHPACPGRFGAEHRLERHPALIALFRDIATNEPRAIHRTFLRPDGSDRLRAEWGAGDQGKMALGRHVGCAVKLSPDSAVTVGVGIGEGAETCLSILAEGWRPVWAMCGTSGVSEFPILPGVDSLTIFGDNDRNSAGRKAAGKAALRWCETGRQVSIITPRSVGSDWCDALRRAA